MEHICSSFERNKIRTDLHELIYELITVFETESVLLSIYNLNLPALCIVCRTKSNQQCT